MSDSSPSSASHSLVRSSFAVRRRRHEAERRAKSANRGVRGAAVASGGRRRPMMKPHTRFGDTSGRCRPPACSAKGQAPNPLLRSLPILAPAVRKPRGPHARNSVFLLRDTLFVPCYIRPQLGHPPVLCGEGARRGECRSRRRSRERQRPAEAGVTSLAEIRNFLLPG